MKKLIGLITLLAIAFTNISNAQVVRNAKEATDNRKAIEIGQAQLEKDIAQLAAYKTKVNAFDGAFANKQLKKVRSLKVDILTDMRREIEQSERKIAQDKKELTQSVSEVKSSKREVRRSRRDRATPDGDVGDGRDLRDDRRDKRDDKRDARDDKADLEKQIARTARQKRILNTLEVFTFSFEPNAMEKAVANKRLMNEFIQTMEADIAATKAELIEDKRGAKEDRKERREDKRERRERLRNKN